MSITTLTKYSVLFLLLLCSLKTSAQLNKVEQEVLSLSKTKFRWMINQNLDSLNSILDERVMYAHSNGWVQTRKDILDDFKSGKLVYKQIDIIDPSVRLYKNTAIVMGKGKFAGVINTTSFSLDLLYTEVYIKRGKHWFLATRHANKMQ